MPTILKTKNSVTTTVVPTTLQQGELAVNITDKKMWVGNAATTPVQLLGDGGSGSFTTVNTTNLEVTNIKAKDGTASASIANSTGIFTHSTATVFTAGTVSLPSITTTGDTNTGIYFPAADTIAFTEGGVESMRINSSGNVGIGGDPTGRLALWASGAVQQYIISTSATSQDNAIVSLCNSGALYSMQAFDAAQYKFLTSGAERMRITSAGNVGIGTSSPTDTISFGRIIDVSSSSLAGGTYYRNSGTGYFGAVGYDGTFGYLGTWGASAGAVRFYTNSTEKMRLDSSGNLGLGVTPSAWVGFTAMQFGGQAYVAGSSLGMGMTSNAYRDAGGFKYIATSGAALYAQASGNSHAWYTAPSGTAGNAITFTQAMTLDASGNLLVGITSARANAGDVQVSKGISFPATQSASSDANTLDDYEEGTWTPAVGGGSGTTYNTQDGWYTKIGNLVTVGVSLVLASEGTITGDARITGLPFTSGSLQRCGGGFAVANDTGTSYVFISGFIENNSTTITIQAKTAASTTTPVPTGANFYANGTQLIATFTYRV
jgi:hypothetical protein